LVAGIKPGEKKISRGKVFVEPRRKVSRKRGGKFGLVK